MRGHVPRVSVLCRVEVLRKADILDGNRVNIALGTGLSDCKKNGGRKSARVYTANVDLHAAAALFAGTVVVLMTLATI